MRYSTEQRFRKYIKGSGFFPVARKFGHKYGKKLNNAAYLDVLMSMYNLLEYIKNYRKATGSLWNYYRDEPTNPLYSNSESFKYKTSITENTYNIGDGEEGYDENKVGKNETEVVIPLKHLRNFWRSLNILLINCELQLILTWSKNSVLADTIFCSSLIYISN